MRQTFSSQLRHKNKSEIVCMCPINSAVVRAFRPEARAKAGEVSPLTIGRLRPRSVKGKNQRSLRDVATERPQRRTGRSALPSWWREGDVVFRHACKMGLEGIVSKRLGSRYRSGRSPDWLKFKNPDAPAVRREEEDWGR